MWNAINLRCSKNPNVLTACSIFQNQQRSNGAGGPTQRASALAALNSAFSSPSPPKSGSAPRPAGASQASSQRAAAIAALSNVLTAEKKQSSESGSPVQSNRSSPVRSSRSSPVRSVDSGPAGIKICFALPFAIIPTSKSLFSLNLVLLIHNFKCLCMHLHKLLCLCYQLMLLREVLTA